jgi:hypothetical protein
MCPESPHLTDPPKWGGTVAGESYYSAAGFGVPRRREHHLLIPTSGRPELDTDIVLVLTEIEQHRHGVRTLVGHGQVGFVVARR